MLSLVNLTKNRESMKSVTQIREDGAGMSQRAVEYEEMALYKEQYFSQRCILFGILQTRKQYKMLHLTVF